MRPFRAKHASIPESAESGHASIRVRKARHASISGKSMRLFRSRLGPGMRQFRVRKARHASIPGSAGWLHVGPTRDPVRLKLNALRGPTGRCADLEVGVPSPRAARVGSYARFRPPAAGCASRRPAFQAHAPLGWAAMRDSARLRRAVPAGGWRSKPTRHAGGQLCAIPPACGGLCQPEAGVPSRRAMRVGSYARFRPPAAGCTSRRLAFQADAPPCRPEAGVPSPRAKLTTIPSFRKH